MAQRQSNNEEQAYLVKFVEDLAARVSALERRVSRQEGDIRGLGGKVEELERR